MKKKKLIGIITLTIACCTIFTYAKKLDYTLDHITVDNQVLTVRIEKARQEEAISSIKQLIENEELTDKEKILDQVKEILINDFQIENASVTIANSDPGDSIINNVIIGNENPKRGIMAYIDSERIPVCSIKHNKAILIIEFMESTNNVATISVVADTSTEAKNTLDAIKDLELDEMLEHLNTVDDVECVVITSDKVIYTSKNIDLNDINVMGDEFVIREI